jgi:hypothetical protein
MNEAAILSWLESTWIGETVRNTFWVFPTLETIHFFGLSILLGALLMLELRLLGFEPGIPIRPALRFIPVAIFGFVLNLISGIGFVCADPFNYWPNPGFKAKMVLILLAGLNALWFEFAERRKLASLPEGAAVDMQAKIISGLSLALWVTIIVLGRLLPYTGAGG